MQCELGLTIHYLRFTHPQESESSGTPQRDLAAAEAEVDLDGSYLGTIEKKKHTSKRTSTPDQKDYKTIIEQLR